MIQSLHSLVRIHHLLHPSLALLLCFRSLPSEPQGRAYNPELLQATVLPSHHGLARYGLSPALTTARICFTDRIFSHSPPSGVWLVPPFWTMFLHCFLHHVMEGGDLPWQELLDWSRLIHSTYFFLFVCRDASPPLACEGDSSAPLPRFDDLFLCLVPFFFLLSSSSCISQT